MVSKKELLKNLNRYSAEQIAEAVRAGEVSLYELSKETQGAFTPMLKSKVKYLIDNPPQEEKKIEDLFEKIEGEQSEIEKNNIEVENAGESEDHVLNEETDEAQEVQQVKVSIDNKGMLKRPFSFRGRIRRLEYALSIVLGNFWSIFVQSVVNNPHMPSGLIFCLALVGIFVMWFLCAQGCKRCHDLGNSGWYQLIPFYGIFMLFVEGDKSDNKYGNNPKK